MMFPYELSLEELCHWVSENPQQVDYRIELVHRYVSEGNASKALDEACQTSEIAPGNPYAQALKALCQMATGDLVNGHQLLMKVMRQNPGCEFQHQLLNELMPSFVDPETLNTMKDPQKLQQLIGEDDGDNQGDQRLVSLAQLAVRVEDEPENSLQLICEHLNQYPYDIDAKLWLAETYFTLGQARPAAKTFREIIDQDEHCTTAYFNLAALVDDVNEAVELTRKGLELCPTNEVGKFNLGVYLFQAQRFEESRRMLSRVPADSPYYVAVLTVTGQCHGCEGNVELAVEYYEKALTLDPSMTEASIELANVHFDCGDLERAVEVLSKALELTPDHPSIYVNLGCYYCELGDLEKSLKCSSMAVEMDDQRPTPFWNMACVHAKQENRDQCLANLTRAVELDSMFGARIMSDPDLQPYLDDPEFLKLTEGK